MRWFALVANFLRIELLFQKRKELTVQQEVSGGIYFTCSRSSLRSYEKNNKKLKFESQEKGYIVVGIEQPKSGYNLASKT